MKPLLIAAALLLAPSAAFAQVAAATVPDSFARPGQTAPAATPVPAAPALAQTPADAKSEDTLRDLIADAQNGTMDYALMSDTLAAKVREQEATLIPVIKGFGAVQAVDFVGSQEGADLFAVTFATQATEWVIGFNDQGKIAVLLFRPAP